MAFWILCEARGWGASGTPLPIPISEVLAYVEFHYIDDLEEREDMLYFVREMDDVYLKQKLQQT